MKLSDLKPLEKNPFKSKGDSQIKLISKSITDFEKMMTVRQIVIDETNTILGGNKRYFALKMLGYKEIPDEWIKQVINWTESEKLEFIVKDNAHWGSEWDIDILNDWNVDVEDWGVNVTIFENNFEREIFEPNLIPETKYSDVTKEQIQKEAEKLASQMIRTRTKIECTCPECGADFEIDG